MAIENTYRQGERLRSLDVLRGIAILGTLGTNIFIFVPYQGMMTKISWFEAMLSQLTNGKFLALLTLMFGIGLAIQHDSAARRNQQWPKVYIWRGILLFLDGVLHYILVFQFDVLMAYSITGLIVSYVLITTPKVQKTIFAIAVLVHLSYLALPVMGVGIPFIGSYGYVIERTQDEPFVIDPAGNRFQQQETKEWYRLDGDNIWNETTQEYEYYGETAQMPGYWDEVKWRLEGFIGGREEAWFIMPMAIALFLLGSFMMRGGLFEPRGQAMRLALIGVGIIAFAWDMGGTVSWLPSVPGNFARYGLPILVSWGLVGGVAEFYMRRNVGWLGARLEDVGRMALSAYVGQNIICTILFSSFALDLAKHIPNSWGIWKVVFAWTAVSSIIIIWATLWRRFFDRGPLEAAWAWSFTHLSKLTPGWMAPRPTPSPAVGD